MQTQKFWITVQNLNVSKASQLNAIGPKEILIFNKWGFFQTDKKCLQKSSHLINTGNISPV